ncbi:MAG: hypothetical protein VXX56_07485 [Pseudomonadota bacterium]|nr:hypothetical protein [Pseudomonadota bacterium]
MGKSKDLATGAAYQDQTESDTRYVNTAGDTMTGVLTANNDIIANKYVRLYTTDDQANQWYVYNNTDDTLRFNYNGAGNDEVVLDTTGRMRVPNQPCFGARGYSGTTTQIGGYNPMLWVNVHTNVGNNFNNSTGKFTFPVSGRYYVECNINLKNTDGSWLGLYFLYNTSVQANSWSMNVSGSQYNDTIVSGVVDATANDYCSFGWHNSYIAPAGSAYVNYNYANIFFIG